MSESRIHPETGRTCLYLGDHAESIVGMDYDEGRALIEELNALAVHPDLSYEHRWKPQELIVWDNRCLMHRATTYDPNTEGRVVRRAEAEVAGHVSVADVRIVEPGALQGLRRVVGHMQQTARRRRKKVPNADFELRSRRVVQHQGSGYLHVQG